MYEFSSVFFVRPTKLKPQDKLGQGCGLHACAISAGNFIQAYEED